MLNPTELDHLNREIAAMADYLARRGERLTRSTLDTMAEALRRQLRYRHLLEHHNSDPPQSERKNAA